MDYHRHPDFDRFVAPAAQRPELWRLAAGLVVVFLVATFGAVLTEPIGQSLYVTPPITDFESQCAGYESFLSCIDGRKAAAVAEAQASPPYALLTLSFFLIVPISLWLLLPVLHQRRFRSLLGPVGLALRQFFSCTWLLLVVSAAIMLIPPWGLGGLEQNNPLGTWLLLLPFGLLGILIQTSAEEFLFRGYVLQQIAARTASPLAWMVVPSVIFGLMHFDASLGSSAAWGIVLWATAFGLCASDLTWRAGSLGPAIALHFVNNISALVLISLDGPLSGLALFVVPTTLAEIGADFWMLVPEFLLLLISWLTCRLALRR